jgi:hypothetical protein
MASEFDILNKEVNRGLEGINEGISFGFPRLDNYISLRKATQYLLGGYTGSGKTTCADEIFVLNPFDQLKASGRLGKFKVIYWSMERRKAFKYAKWFSRKCFIEQGERIPMDRLLGWVKKEQRLTKNEHDMFIMYEDYFNELFEHVTVIDGRQKPTAIRKYLKDLSDANGRIEKIDDYHKVYVPNDESLLILNVFDHVGKIQREFKMTGDKEVIDVFSDDVSNTYRDLYGMSSVIVSQFNRSISNPMRLKQEDVTPMLEDFKSTSDMAEDSDVVMSIFDPWRYKVADPSGYTLDFLKDERAFKYYRNLQILKNSFGGEDIRIGMAYEPEMGIFREMPKKLRDADLPKAVYESITNGSYFLRDSLIKAKPAVKIDI